MPFTLPRPAGPASPFEQNRQFLLGQSPVPAPAPAERPQVAGGLAPPPSPVPQPQQTQVAPQGGGSPPSASALGAPSAGSTFGGRPLPGEQPVAAAGAPIPKSSGGSAGAPAPQVGQAPAPASAPAPQTATPAPGPINPAPGPNTRLDLSQGVLGGLTKPIYQGVQSGQQSLQQIGSQFREAAGPSRSFASAGGPGILGQAIDPTLTGTAGDSAFQAARGLLESDYTGPTDLDPTKYAGLQGDLTQIGQRLGGLATGGGLVASLQTGVPGLSGGMARYDAERLMGDPGYARERIAAQDALQGLQGQAAEERKQAQTFAAQRDQEEAAIAKASEDFLTGKRDTTLGGIDTRVQEAQGNQDAVQKAYSKLLDTGDISALYTGRSLPVGSVNPKELQQFITPESRQTEQAVADYWRVAEKFPDIKNVPPLELTINDRGNEKYSLAGDGSDEEIFDSYKQGDITKETFEQLKARQELWEQLGLSPGTTKSPDGSEPQAGRGNSTVAPLYFGKNPGSVLENLYQDPDKRPYFSLDPGTTAARENLSTKDERYMVNRIGSLLDEAYRLDEAKEPFRAAKVAADAERFLGDVEREIEERKARGESSSKSFINQVNKAKKQYSKARRSKSFGKVARVVGGVATGGMTEASGATPIMGPLQRSKVEPLIGTAGFNTFT